MPEFTIKLEGQEEFKVRVSNFNRILATDLEKIVKRNATRVTKVGKSNAPVGPTGNLQNSIRSKDVSKKLGLSYKLAKTTAARKKMAPHRHLVELGTRDRMTKAGAARGRMPSNPFMARVENAVAPQYQREIRERIFRKEEL